METILNEKLQALREAIESGQSPLPIAKANKAFKACLKFTQHCTERFHVRRTTRDVAALKDNFWLVKRSGLDTKELFKLIKEGHRFAGIQEAFKAAHVVKSAIPAATEVFFMPELFRVDGEAIKETIVSRDAKPIESLFHERFKFEFDTAAERAKNAREQGESKELEELVQEFVVVEHWDVISHEKALEKLATPGKVKRVFQSIAKGLTAKALM